MDLIKDYINIDVLTLIVAFLTLVVGILALIVSMSALKVAKGHFKYDAFRDKQQVFELLSRKRAQLQGMEESMRWGGVEVSAAAHLRVEMSALQAEIKELEKQL